MNYLLDTNIVLTYLRDNQYSRKIEEQLRLFDFGNTLLVSVVVVGELKSLAIQNNWGNKKIKKLLQMLTSDFIIVDINIEEIIETYAIIDAFSQGKLNNNSSFTSRNMGKNDLWIAATSSALDLTLITMDNDFNHLNDVYINLKSINRSDF